MKFLIYIFSIFFALNASVFAGNIFVDIEKPMAKSMLKAVEQFKQFNTVVETDYSYLHADMLNYKVREGGTVAKALRHYIWKTLSGTHSTPDEVISKAISKDELESKLNAIYDYPVHFENGEVSKEEFDIEKQKFVKTILAMKKYVTIQFYYLSYGNEYGGCNAVTAVDDYYKEFVNFNFCQYQD